MPPRLLLMASFKRSASGAHLATIAECAFVSAPVLREFFMHKFVLYFASDAYYSKHVHYPKTVDSISATEHAYRFINRRPALRDHLPETGPFHPSVIELNLLLGRKLYNIDGIELILTVARDRTFTAACVGDDCAELELLEAFSRGRDEQFHHDHRRRRGSYTWVLI